LYIWTLGPDRGDGRYEFIEEKDAPDGEFRGSPAADRALGLVDSRVGYGEPPELPYRGARRPEELLNWGMSLSRISSDRTEVTRGGRA
jgi:hypothetical protein